MAGPVPAISIRTSAALQMIGITGTRPVMTREANVQPIRDNGMGLFS
jgi:hypothetical protein